MRKTKTIAITVFLISALAVTYHLSTMPDNKGADEVIITASPAFTASVETEKSHAEKTGNSKEPNNTKEAVEKISTGTKPDAQASAINFEPANIDKLFQAANCYVYFDEEHLSDEFKIAVGSFNTTEEEWSRLLNSDDIATQLESALFLMYGSSSLSEVNQKKIEDILYKGIFYTDNPIMHLALQEYYLVKSKEVVGKKESERLEYRAFSHYQQYIKQVSQDENEDWSKHMEEGLYRRVLIDMKAIEDKQLTTAKLVDEELIGSYPIENVITRRRQNRSDIVTNELEDCWKDTYRTPFSWLL